MSMVHTLYIFWWGRSLPLSECLVTFDNSEGCLRGTLVLPPPPPPPPLSLSLSMFLFYMSNVLISIRAGFFFFLRLKRRFCLKISGSTLWSFLPQRIHFWSVASPKHQYQFVLVWQKVLVQCSCDVPVVFKRAYGDHGLFTASACWRVGCSWMHRSCTWRRDSESFCLTWTKQYLVTSPTRIKRVSQIHHRINLS